MIARILRRIADKLDPPAADAPDFSQCDRARLSLADPPEWITHRHEKPDGGYELAEQDEPVWCRHPKPPRNPGGYI